MRLAILLVVVVAPVCADLREVTKVTIAGHETVYAQYVQGKNRRTEDLGQDHSPRLATIWNPERKTRYELDLRSQEYVEHHPGSADWIFSLAMWIARAPRLHESGKTVNIYYEAIDTGERREFFGHTAKHLLVSERHVAQPGACEPTYQIQKDGWYIPPAEAGARGSYHLSAYAGFAGRCLDTIVKHGVSSPPGIPVLERDGEVTREILALSNDPLDKSLFEIPSGFRKVDALPGRPAVTSSDRLALEWRLLEQAVESWFE